MDEIDDGGPAFPTADADHAWQWSGLSLRDYFAANASNEDLAIPENMGECAKLVGLADAKDYKPAIHYPMLVAKARYALADAMLAVRSPRRGSSHARSLPARS